MTTTKLAQASAAANKYDLEKAQINRVLLAGNIGKEPVVKTTAKGSPMLSFSLAVNHPRQPDKGQETSWFRITLFGPTVEQLKHELKAGLNVTVLGRLNVNKDLYGATYYGIVADEIHLNQKRSFFAKVKLAGTTAVPPKTYFEDTPDRLPCCWLTIQNTTYSEDGLKHHQFYKVEITDPDMIAQVKAAEIETNEPIYVYGRLAVAQYWSKDAEGFRSYFKILPNTIEVGEDEADTTEGGYFQPLAEKVAVLEAERAAATAQANLEAASAYEELLDELSGGTLLGGCEDQNFHILNKSHATMLRTADIEKKQAVAFWTKVLPETPDQL